MPLAPAPTGDNFKPSAHVGQLIGVRGNRTAMVADTFGRNEGNPLQAIYFDVWMLTGPQAGKTWRDSMSTTRFGRQLIDSGVGTGEIYYGRIVEERVGQGMSQVLAAPDAQDQQMIDRHRDWLAANPPAPGYTGLTQEMLADRQPVTAGYQQPHRSQDVPPQSNAQPVSSGQLAMQQPAEPAPWAVPGDDNPPY